MNEYITHMVIHYLNLLAPFPDSLREWKKYTLTFKHICTL